MLPLEFKSITNGIQSRMYARTFIKMRFNHNQLIERTRNPDVIASVNAKLLLELAISFHVTVNREAKRQL